MNDPASNGTAKGGPGDPQKSPGQARGDEHKADAKEPTFDRMAKDHEKLKKDGPDSDAAAKDLADIARQATDPRKSELAREILQKNGRDPSTGKKTKNPFGTNGKSPGISDNLKKDAANREFAARIGQMQLDDWQKRLTPEMLKKAGISEAEWKRFVQNTNDYSAQVRAVNAQIARQVLSKQLNAPRTAVGPTVIDVERIGTSTDTPGATAPPPPEIRDPLQLFSQPRPK